MFSFLNDSAFQLVEIDLILNFNQSECTMNKICSVYKSIFDFRLFESSTHWELSMVLTHTFIIFKF